MFKKPFDTSYILLLLFLFSLQIGEAQNTSASKKKLTFTENKNQWQKQILFKADIKHGSFFAEKNCFTFNFVDPADIEHNHKSGHQERAHKKEPIHFFAYKAHFLNSNPNVEISGTGSSTYYSNYFLGNDKSKWASHVKNFEKIVYKNLYKNIDLEVYSKGSDLKYDFIVRKGGNVDDITIKYEGLKDIELTEGNLRLITTFSTITELSPVAYEEPITQSENNNKKIDCRFILENNTVRFKAESYNKNKALIIDPQLIFSTYSGSVADNWGFTATFDNENNVYSGGIAFGTGYPVSTGAYQVDYAGDVDYYFGEDIAIIKYDSLGKKRLYATYLGGNSAELPYSLVVNESNELLIFGTTGSDNFPISSNAYSKTFRFGTLLTYDDVIQFKNGTDIFVTKLSSDGSTLLASTYLGGTDNDGFNYRDRYQDYLMDGNDSLYYNYADGARGEIITDNLNNVYVGGCTFSNDFPVTSSAFRQASGGKQEGVAFKFNSDLSALLWSTYIGGSNDDAIYSIDVDDDYNVYVAGGTNSLNFPTSQKSYHKNYQGGSADGFVSKISKDGSNLLGSTYFGSVNYDQAYFVRVDKQNFPYITGQTKASGNTLIFNAKYNKPNSGQFITKLNSTLDSVKWSTVFGTGNGRPNISITAFAVDVCNKIYLAGWGREWPFSSLYPTWSSIEGTKKMDITSDAVQKVTDGMDFYIMVLEKDASKLFYGTFFGELNNSVCNASGRDHVDGGTSRFDKRGNIYESVCASCSAGTCQSFPTTSGAWSRTDNSDNCNNAVFKINVFSGLTFSAFDAKIICSTNIVNFLNSSEGRKFKWDFGDNTTSSTEKNPIHMYKNPGKYIVKLIVYDSLSCNGSDTLKKEIFLPNELTINLKSTTKILCDGDCSGNASVTSLGGIPPYKYEWSGGQKDSILTNLCSGQHTVTVTDQAGCKNITDVTIDSLKLKLDTLINSCYGLCRGLATISAAGGSQPYTYLWDDGQTGRTASELCAGNHSVTVTEKNGFKCSLNFTINESPKMSLNIEEQNKILCFGKCDGILKAIVSGGVPPYAYQWNLHQGYDTLQNVCAGDYKLVVLDKNNCRLDTNITVTSPSEIKVSILTTKVPCEIICNGMATAIVTGGKSPYAYLWDNGNSGTSVSDLCMGEYKIKIVDANLCEVVKNFSIKDSSLFSNTKVQAVPDKIHPGESSQLDVIPSIIEYSYIWSPANDLNNPTISNPVAKPNKTTTYYVTITSDIGCAHEDSVTVFILLNKCAEPYIFIPNAFTPDANQNNILYVRSSLIESLYFVIYNRWGEKVFETTDIKKGWDGTYKGKPVNPGVFDYYIEATCTDKDKFKHKGNITLIR